MGFEHVRVYQAAEQLDAVTQKVIPLIPAGFAKDIDHLQRAFASIKYNIAEAYGCEKPGRKAERLETARGSADEVRAVLQRLVALEALPRQLIWKPSNLSRTIAKMLTSWIASLPKR
jgi:four helix bundle protein